MKIFNLFYILDTEFEKYIIQNRTNIAKGKIAGFFISMIQKHFICMQCKKIYVNF